MRCFSEKTLLAVLTVCVCTVAAVTHRPVLSAQALSLDDNEYLSKNSLVQNPSWSSAKRFLTEVLEPSTVRGYYQPLTMISLMADCAMGAGPKNLRPVHLTNLILHIANTALVIVLLYLLFKQVWAATMAGLLFGVHPITVESIAWVAERKTLLATFFALLCLIFYVGYSIKGRGRFYAGWVITYVLALMSKPITTPIPVLLLLLDFWPLRRLSKRTVLEKVPLFVIGGIFAFITVVSQSRTAEATMPTKHNFLGVLVVVCHNIVFYLHKICWPVKLSVFYPFPKPLSVANPAILAGVIGSLILAGVLVLSLRWTRALVTGWLFFFAAIFPTMGVITFTDSVAANRFLYLPALGFLMVLCALFVNIWQNSQPGRRLRTKQIVLVAAVAVLAGLEIKAARSNHSHWRESVSHFRHMLTLTGDSDKINYNLGLALSEQGQNAEAIVYFKEALRIKPDFHKAHNNLGAVLAQQGDLDGAIIHFTEAIKIKPESDRAHHNLGQALFLKGDAVRAVEHYRQALRLQPDSAETMAALSWILATNKNEELRDGDEAVRLAKRACELTNYGEVEMLNILAAACAEAGDFAKATEVTKKAIDSYVSTGKKDLAELAAKKLQLYETGKPYRTK